MISLKALSIDHKIKRMLSSSSLEEHYIAVEKYIYLAEKSSVISRHMMEFYLSEIPDYKLLNKFKTTSEGK